MAKKITVQITPKHNSWWAGRGRVTSVNLEMGFVFVEMETGREKGKIGGFDLDKVKFKVQREQPECDTIFQ